MPNIKCLNCNIEISIRPYQVGRTKFCSKNCINKFKRITKNCKECGKSFTMKRCREETKKYCSKICQSNWRSKNISGKNHPCYKTGNSIEKVKINCRVCGNEFFQLRKILLKGFGDICSKECRAKNTSQWQLQNSPNVKEKVLVKCEWCSKEKHLIPSFTKTFRFCSQKCRNNWQSKRMSGENSPNWNGGTSELRQKLMATREYKAWRIAVFTRDNFTCQKCGDKRGGNLHAHHIKPLATHPELCFTIENGLTVCVGCHTKIHQEMPSIKGKGRLKEVFHSLFK